MSLKINLGCGPYRAEGYVNIDKNPQQMPDLVHDVRHGLPYTTSTVDEIRAWHVLEHLTNDPCLDCIEEAFRVLKPDGLFDVIVPLGVTGCLDHCMIFTEHSFDLLVREEAATYFMRNFCWSEHSKGIEDLGWAKALHVVLLAKK